MSRSLLDLNICPEDYPLFIELESAMRRVAQDYELPLVHVTGLPDRFLDAEKTTKTGDCQPATGVCRLFLREKVNGAWGDRRSDGSIYDTAAHELAHLRHLGHGEEFWTLTRELREALENTRQTHRQKIISKVVKMQAQRDGEAALGNSAAAEAFAERINRMMIAHELSATDLDYARADKDDPVIEVWVDLAANGVKRLQTRSAWQQTLASIVADAHLCVLLVRPGCNDICFVGVRSHALVAEFAYVTLVRAAEQLSLKAWVDYWREGGGRVRDRGFRPSWLAGFTGRIYERFKEARAAAVREFDSARAPAPGTESTALIRLSGALTRARRHVDEKLSNGRRKPRGAAALRRSQQNNSDGYRRGRDAADQVAMGRKGVASGRERGRLSGE